MSAFFTATKEKVLLYWLIGFYCILFSGVSLAGAWLTATAGVDYSTLGPDAKQRIWVGIFSVWGTTMTAFLNKGIGNLQKGGLPIDADNGKVLSSRTDTTVQQTQVTETKPP
jgi:hypothetical protein